MSKLAFRLSHERLHEILVKYFALACASSQKRIIEKLARSEFDNKISTELWRKINCKTVKVRKCDGDCTTTLKEETFINE